MSASTASLAALVVELRLAARNLRRQGLRSLAALLSVIVGIALLMIASGMIAGMLADLRESNIRSQFGHVQVSLVGYHGAGQADPMRYLLPPPAQWGEQARDAIAALRPAPRLSGSGLVSHGESTLSMLFEGIDPALEPADDKAQRIVAGRPLRAGQRGEVILGAGLAQLLDVHPGDKVALLANTARGGMNAVELMVVGVFRTVNQAYDEVALRISIDDARALVRAEGAHRWLFFLADTDDTDALAARLRAALPATRYDVAPWYRLAEFYNRAAALLQQQLGVVKLIIAVIIVLGISNTLTMSVLERTTEIGTCLALGDRRAQVLRQFVLEGLLLGALGGALGVALGAAGCVLLGWAGVDMPPAPGMAVGYTARAVVTTGNVVQSLALALGATLVASLLPAWKASRLDIVDALRTAR